MKSKSELVGIYKKLLKGDFAGWVLFNYSTCVIIPHVNKTIQEDATTILRKYGRIIPGTPLGDFNVTPLKDNLGWVVTGNHPDILNFVAADDVKEKSDDEKIDLLGRERKELDAKELKIIHVEQIVSP